MNTVANRLELSKARLASALNNLESVIEAKIQTMKVELSGVELLKKQKDQLHEKNGILEDEVANLELDQQKIKDPSLEIIKDLEHSILSIEEILGKNNGNSKHLN